jgi:hypothetical protein
MPVNPTKDSWILGVSEAKGDPVGPVFRESMLSSDCLDSTVADSNFHKNVCLDVGTIILPESGQRFVNTSLSFGPRSQHISKINDFVHWVSIGQVEAPLLPQ